MNLIGTGEESKLSVFLDPFKKDKVSKIIIMMSEDLYDNFYWFAKVSFRNGNTSGEQKTKYCDSYEEVYIELNKILESL